ncbi:MAG: LptA/OstA family protein [Rhizobiaceae bacterium]
MIARNTALLCLFLLVGIAPARATDATAGIDAGNVPVEITAQSLVISQDEQTAVFSGDVVATQGETRLKSRTMSVRYTNNGQAENTLGGNLEKVVAQGDVVIETAGQTASADMAVVEPARSVAELSGNVALVQGETRFETDRMTIELLPGNGQNGSTSAIGKVIAPGPVTIISPGQSATAQSAIIDMQARIATLTGDVTVNSGDGKLTAESMEVAFSSNGQNGGQVAQDGVRNIVARTNVRLQSGKQLVRADTLDIRTQERVAHLSGNVSVSDGPSSLSTAKLRIEYAASQAGTSAIGGNVRRVIAPGAITLRSKDQTVTAASANIDVPGQLATLAGNVEVKQGGSRMRTQKLLVRFNSGGGSSSLGGGIRQIDAPGKVRLTSSDQVVTADRAVVRMKEDRAVLSGNVVLSQGKNVVKGCELDFNLATQFASVKKCPDQSGGRVKMLLTPGKTGAQQQ